jgi:hypothetical protein
LTKLPRILLAGHKLNVQKHKIDLIDHRSRENILEDAEKAKP